MIYCKKTSYYQTQNRELVSSQIIFELNNLLIESSY